MVYYVMTVTQGFGFAGFPSGREKKGRTPGLRMARDFQERG
jgi:hypothetical protein